MVENGGIEGERDGEKENLIRIDGLKKRGVVVKGVRTSEENGECGRKWLRE